MAFIDGSVVNVALPVLQKDLGATVADVQWIVESYTLFLSALILVGGSMGDIYGRRKVFAAGVIIFTLASVWCGLAPDVTQLIIARGAQGIGGALLVPGSLAIISAFYPDEEKRGRAIGTWSGFTAITAVLGPVLGGWLVEHASWHWVFFINAPLAVVVLAITFWFVPESRDEEDHARLDWLGALLITVSLGALVYGLVESSNVGLGNARVIAALVVGAVLLPIFLLVESRSDWPMMPLSLFRSRTFSGTNLLTLLLYAALSGAMFFLPFNLIQVQGYSPTAAGGAMLPFILVMFLLSRWSGGLIGRYGARLPLIVGPTLAGIGFALFAVIPGIGGSYWTTFFPPMMMLGIGMAISVAPLTTAVMGSVSVKNAGVASGINNAVSRVAGLLAIAVLGIVVLNAFNNRLDARLERVPIPSEARRAIDAQRTKLAGAEAPPGLPAGTRRAIDDAVDEAFVGGFRLAMYIAAGLALAGALSAVTMIDGKAAKKAPGGGSGGM
jgi:EmrB/QacA subfamily drug resistance transporter